MSDPDASSSRIRRGWAVSGIVAALLVGLCWTISTPPGSASDDDKHLPSIWCGLGERPGLCVRTADPAVAEVPTLLVAAPGCFAFKPETSAACQPDVTADLRTYLRAAANVDQLTATPGLFHRAMAVFAGGSLRDSVWLMRMANVVLAILLVGAALYASGGGLRPALALAWLVAPIPLGLYVIASTNPSAWAVIGLGTFWALLLGFWRAPDRQRRVVAGAGALVAAVIAAGSRTDAAAFLVVVTLAVTLLEWGPRVHEARVRWRELTPALAAVLLGLIVFRLSGQYGVAVGGLPSAVQDGSGPSLLFRNAQNLPMLWSGAFGGWALGWLDTPVPYAVGFAITGLVVALILLGLARTTAWKNVALLVVFALVSALPLWILQESRRIVGNEVQPRYLLPALLVLVGLALVTSDRRPPIVLSRTQAWVIWSTVVLAQAVSLMFVIRRYAMGTDGSLLITDAPIEWWSNGVLGPEATLAAGSAAFAWLAYILVFRLVGRARAAHPPSATAADPTSAPSRRSAA